MAHPNAINLPIPVGAPGGNEVREEAYRRHMTRLLENVAALKAGLKAPATSMKNYLETTRRLHSEHAAAQLAQAKPPTGNTWIRRPNGSIKILPKLPIKNQINKLERYLELYANFQNNTNGKNWNTIHTNAIKLANEVGLSYNGPRNGKYFFYALHPNVAMQAYKKLERLKARS